MANLYWQLCAQQRSRCKKVLGGCAVGILLLLVVGLIHSCHLICCSQPALASPSHNLNALGHGFQSALQNSAKSELLAHRKPQWWRPFVPASNKVEYKEALASKAEAALKRSFQRERKAQETVRAVLHRREIKHKKLLRGLEEGGWRISVNERSSAGPLQSACDMLRVYLQSTEYQIARKLRAQQSKGRGIAIAAGHALNLANAYVALHMLRNVHNSKLPVEIFFNGEQEFDLPSQQLFEEDFQDVSCIDVSKHRLPAHMAWIQKSKDISDQQDGWMTKSQMLYLTSFEEVLVLDSDNVPLKDPAFLFESETYTATGNLFWPDFWTNNFLNPGPAYSFLGLPNPWAEDTEVATTESGQFLIDRRRHDDVLEWVVLLNLEGELVYDLVWGDKDTYRLAFSLAGKGPAFTQIVHKPANALQIIEGRLAPAFMHFNVRVKNQNEPIKIVMQTEEEEPQMLYKHAGMIQVDPDGSMLFLHRTSDAKLDPALEYPWGYQPLHFITTPLSARQAAVVHLSGGMDMDKFEQKITSSCPRVGELALTQIAAACDLLDSGNRETMPGDISRSFPVPIFDVDDFPALQYQIEESMQAFRHLQRLFLSRQIRLGIHDEAEDGNAPLPSF